MSCDEAVIDSLREEPHTIFRSIANYGTAFSQSVFFSQKTEESQGQAKVEEVPCAAEAQKADGVAVDGDCLTEGLSAHRAVEEGAGTRRAVHSETVDWVFFNDFSEFFQCTSCN